MRDTVNIGFIGNPNCGKTTLFNAYTGAKLKVANWPGVTVEKKEGSMQYQGHTFKLVDLPGIYSLTSYTMEEKVSREFILSDDVDVIVDIADASALERNLYLTLQLIELGKPVVLALNMMDIVEERGMEIDLHRLPEMLGIPVVPVSARKKRGLDILMHAVAHHMDDDEPANALIHEHGDTEESTHVHDHHSEYAMVYSDEIEDKIDAITVAKIFCQERRICRFRTIVVTHICKIYGSYATGASTTHKEIFRVNAIYILFGEQIPHSGMSVLSGLISRSLDSL